jgi:RNA polymerase sigma-70 factor (ECF subfamily)
MKSTGQTYPRAEEALLAKAAEGSLDAFNELVIQYQNMAYSLALSMVGDAAAAEDVAQVGFIKAFQNFHSYRGGSFQAWLLRIISNTAYDHHRQAKRYPVVPFFEEEDGEDEQETSAWFVDPVVPVETAVEQNEERRRLQHMLDELPAIYRSVITLVDLYELDYDQAAGALNIPMGTVKSRLARARQQMRRKLEGERVAQFALAAGLAA